MIKSTCISAVTSSLPLLPHDPAAPSINSLRGAPSSPLCQQEEVGLPDMSCSPKMLWHPHTHLQAQGRERRRLDPESGLEKFPWFWKTLLPVKGPAPTRAPWVRRTLVRVRLHKGRIYTGRSQKCFQSRVLSGPKPDGSSRLILVISDLNQL